MIIHPFKKPFRGTPLISGHPLVEGLIACYPCNENTGNIVHDYSGFKQHLYRQSGVWDQFGVYGTYWMSQTGAYTPSSSNPVTLLAIPYKNTSHTGAKAIFAYGTTGTGDVCYIGQNSSSDISGGVTGIGTTVSTGKTFNVGHRHVVVVTQTGGYFRVFAEGVFIGSDTFSVSIPTTGKVIVINRLGTGGIYYWDRRVECAMMWERVLTDEEIAYISQDPYRVFKKAKSVLYAPTSEPASPPYCYGEENPSEGESPIAWTAFSDGAAGSPVVLGSSSWGKLNLNTAETAHGPVINTGNTDIKTVSITRDYYGTGKGDVVFHIRGQAGVFTQDAGTPSWELYTVPINKTWQYIQLKVTEGT